MKVIFSRKGFDAQYGGMPSPILIDGRMVPLPIPSTHDSATLASLDMPDLPLGALLLDLSGGRISLETRVHRDPDLGGSHAISLDGWRPALGQTGAAQSHLGHQGVGIGDVFLFFGWFRHVEFVDGRWRFAPDAPDLHVLFGWLEVDEVLAVVTQRDAVLRRYRWLAHHPHVSSPDWYTDPRNTLYVGRSVSAYATGGTVGGGRFQQHRPELQLTCPGRTRSVWCLPRWFAPQGRPPISYHPRDDQWEIRDDDVLLRSAAKGQEFVIDGACYPELEAWVGGLIRRNA